MIAFGAAVIGSAGVGALHIETLRSLEGAELRAVVGASAASSRRAATRHGVSTTYEHWADVVGAGTVDVVHVCTPNDTHAEIAGAALAAGKHVVCEKPLAHSLSAGRSLAATAADSGAAAVLCYPYRFLPLVQRLRGVVAGGSLGTVLGVRAEYLQNWLLFNGGDWRSDPARAGRSRVLADIGIHLVDLVEHVTGSIAVSVSAAFHSRHPDGAGPDDQALLLLGLDNGAVATATLSQVSAGDLNRLSIAVDGTQGSARWSVDDVERLAVVPAGSAAALRLDADVRPATSGQFWKSAVEPGAGLRDLLVAAYALIRDGRHPDGSPLPTFADGVRHLAVIDAACAALDEPDLRPIDRFSTTTVTTTGGNS